MSKILCPQAGKVAGNPTAGRKLMEAVSCIPQMDGMKFESILNSTMQVYSVQRRKTDSLGSGTEIDFFLPLSLHTAPNTLRSDSIWHLILSTLCLSVSTQDHLMVVYLFNLVKTQLVLGEKLCQITS